MSADLAIVQRDVSVAPYLELVKFRYHITFVNVVFGTLIFARELTPWLGLQLVCLYVSFNVLLYGGIYTLNDIADRVVDAEHPHKRERPVASCRVSVRGAVRFAAMSIAAGLLTGVLWLGTGILPYYAAILGLNLLYSSAGRNIRYVDLLLNALPHVVRFAMGVWLVDRIPTAGHLLAFLSLAIAMSALRRAVEHDVSGCAGRQTLRRYTRRALDATVLVCVASLAILTTLYVNAAPGFFAIVDSAALVLLGGGYSVPAIRRELRTVWIR